MKISLLLIFSCSILMGFSQSDVRMDSIAARFEYNRSEIINAEELLEQLGKLDGSKLASVRLVGYTDSTGSVTRNQTLAAERIRSVQHLLDQAKFSVPDIKTENANETAGFRTVPDELNRRVDILFSVKHDPQKPALAFELNKPVNLNINFVGGQDVFLEESYPKLDQLLEILLSDSTLSVELLGHVCCANDYELSLKRAKAVYNFLNRNGIAKARMSAEGYSNSRRLVPDDTQANMSLNRRVEAVFHRETE